MYLNYSQIFSMEPMELLQWLSENFGKTIPVSFESAEEMAEASQIMLECTNNFSYLSELLSVATIQKVQFKNEGDKCSYNDMILKEKIIDNCKKAVLQQYAAISRAITVKSEINRELNMSSNNYMSEDSFNYGEEYD